MKELELKTGEMILLAKEYYYLNIYLSDMIFYHPEDTAEISKFEERIRNLEESNPWLKDTCHS